MDDDYTSRDVDLRSQATSRALMSEDDVSGKEVEMKLEAREATLDVNTAISNLFQRRLETNLGIPTDPNQN